MKDCIIIAFFKPDFRTQNLIHFNIVKFRTNLKED